MTGLKSGDAVTAYYYLTCGHCHWCRINRETLCDNLARARRTRRGRRLRRVHQAGGEELHQAAAGTRLARASRRKSGVITDAIATPVKVIRKTRVTPHDTVAVFGAGGGLGVHMLKVARWARARKVIGVDIMASKFETCVKCGADATVDASDGRAAEQLLELTGGKGVDVAIDFVCANGDAGGGVEGPRQGRALHHARRQQQAVHGGSHADFMRKEAEIMSSRYATRQEVLDSLELVARGELWPLVTEKAPLAQAEAIHERLDKGLVTGRAALVM